MAQQWMTGVRTAQPRNTNLRRRFILRPSITLMPIWEPTLLFVESIGVVNTAPPASDPAGNQNPGITCGARLQCSLGDAPSLLTIPPNRNANINDAIPIINIPSFGLCTSISNPQVAAATAAAFGVLTPMPCTPVTTRWSSDTSDLQSSSCLNCANRGKITIG